MMRRIFARRWPAPLLGLACLLAAAAFTVLACALVEPRWESNDDVGMAMVAHGYGIAATASPEIVFSNVLWGHLAQAIGSVDGVLGYTIAGYAALVLAGAVLMWAAFRCGLGVIGAAGVFALLLLRALWFPQFTVTSGLLMVASACCLALYPQRRASLLPWLAALLAFASFLVRRDEFLVVAAVLAPVLPWALLARERQARLAAAALASAIALAAWMNYTAYSQEAWRPFNELNPPRAAFTDFGQAQRLVARPDLLARHGFSVNDVEMVGSWFFADPALVDPTRLRAVLADLGEARDTETDLGNAWLGVASLADPRLVWALACAALATLLLPSRRVLLAWGFCIAGLALVGFLGRPSQLRIYDPLVAALLFAPLLRAAWRPEPPPTWRWSSSMVAGLLALAAVFHTWPLVDLAQDEAPQTAVWRREIQKFPADTVVVWGSNFPFEWIYAPLVRHQERLPARIYALGAFTLAPFSVACAEARTGRDMMTRLRGPDGVLMLASDWALDRMSVHCREHFGGKLGAEMVHLYPWGALRIVRCPPPAPRGDAL
ncbi:hypothetical protein HHL11_28800 [Ramlibacter sp. G-1-2-2]|uniref:Glycosyltransferase RgtA/B/C/D-like domain-containing protein n=1 Tax=Ramlibacter agri TaxID=2728837 RepID=A0A848HCD7_9BURK|nr:hypothetical protein [Ramlibacter agri]NML47782.1 hypothetical protein [Ramlibacter agri]